MEHKEDGMLSSPPSLSRSTSRSSFALPSTGDLIGSESGIHLSSSDDALSGEQGIVYSDPISCFRKMTISEKGFVEKRDFPPPLTSLVSTDDLIGRVPWVFDRHYVDGRLIVTKKRAKRCKSLETYRENGRLVMNLVPFDDAFEGCHSDYESDYIDFGVQTEETCDTFSSAVEGEEKNENQEKGMK